MVSNENLRLISYREPIGTRFLAEKGHFLIFSKKNRHFRSEKKYVLMLKNVAQVSLKNDQNHIKMSNKDIYFSQLSQNKF